MDEIKQRLSDASTACIETYQAWCAKTGDTAAREALQEAVHELRRVAARLEIELAVSDRKTQGSGAIPIPAHRAARRAPEAEGDDAGDGQGNAGGRGPRGPMQGNRRPVPIRSTAENTSEAAPVSAAPDSAPAETSVAADAAPRRGRPPLSLKRSSGNEGEAG